MLNLTEARLSQAPYPGLRPFQSGEADIFFGREEQTDQLLEKLQRSRFLAVVGPSGCGKSSLVRAGMIAALETGFMADAGARWRIADMRPGDQPLARLAESLLRGAALGAEHEGRAGALPYVLATLRRGRLGLVEVVRETPLAPADNLLLLVDQFEEIFRYREQGDAAEADAFVSLLLATAAQREVPVYVVVTMRSDFLGDCALFEGLPEAINDSQFLTPRLTREQNSAAIVGPARVFGGEVEEALLNRLLNALGPDPDRLPLLQHVLMRMWRRVEGQLGQTAGGLPRAGAATMTPEDYEAVGGLSKALSEHADQVYEELRGGPGDGAGARRQGIAEVMFRCLTERGVGKRDTRRPARLREVAAVACVRPEEVATVADAFRREGRNFVTPPDTPLAPETVLDIGHESLISKWGRLDEWVSDEARAAATYQRLAQSAELWLAGSDLLGEAELDRALKLMGEHRSARAWARRYSKSPADFRNVVRLIRASRRHWAEVRREEEAALRRQREQEIERQRAQEKAEAAKMYKRLAGVLALVALLALGAMVWLSVQIRITYAQQKRAEDVGRQLAEKNNELQKQITLADDAKANADSKAGEAEAARSQLSDALKIAEDEKRRANSAAANADRHRKEAEVARAKLAQALQVAKTQTTLAQNSAKLEKDLKHLAQQRYDELVKLQEERDRQQAASEAKMLGDQGEVNLNFGDFDAAIKALNQALPLYQKAGDRAGEVNTLVNLGKSYKGEGSDRPALDHFQRALAIFRETGDEAGQSIVLLEIGTGYLKLGDNEKARDNLLASLPLLQKAGDDGQVVIALINLSEAYRKLGDDANARKYARMALDRQKVENAPRQ